MVLQIKWIVDILDFLCDSISTPCIETGIYHVAVVLTGLSALLKWESSDTSCTGGEVSGPICTFLRQFILFKVLFLYLRCSRFSGWEQYFVVYVTLVCSRVRKTKDRVHGYDNGFTGCIGLFWSLSSLQWSFACFWSGLSAVLRVLFCQQCAFHGWMSRFIANFTKQRAKRRQ